MNKIFRNIFLSFILSAVLACFSACKPYAHINKVETNIISIDTISLIQEDSGFISFIKPYKEKMDSQMNDVLVYSEQAMMKGLPEGLLNNFVSDLVLLKSNEYYTPADGQKIDFCLLNNGGLRAALPKGAITRKNVFELLPFENKIVVMTLTAEKIKQMFIYIAKSGGMPISGFSMGIKDTIPVNISIKGKALDTTRKYKVVTSDYLAAGGDKMRFFSNPVNKEELSIKMRDAIITYMTEEHKKGNKLKVTLDNRIYYDK